jgi:hypothetical protein
MKSKLSPPRSKQSTFPASVGSVQFVCFNLRLSHPWRLGRAGGPGRPLAAALYAWAKAPTVWMSSEKSMGFRITPMKLLESGHGEDRNASHGCDPPKLADKPQTILVRHLEVGEDDVGSEGQWGPATWLEPGAAKAIASAASSSPHHQALACAPGPLLHHRWLADLPDPRVDQLPGAPYCRAARRSPLRHSSASSAPGESGQQPGREGDRRSQAKRHRHQAGTPSARAPAVSRRRTPRPAVRRA